MQKSEEEGRRQRDPGKPGVAAELVCLRSTGERASVSRAKKRDAGDESRVVTHWGADRPEGWWLVVVGKRWRALRRGVTRYELDINRMAQAAGYEQNSKTGSRDPLAVSCRKTGVQ